MDNQHELVVSFVHGYSDLNHKVERPLLPALWSVGSEGGTMVHEYPFPRNVSDFLASSDLLLGSMPLPGASDFMKLPRFGLTGLGESGNYLFAGSWNGVYKIRKDNFGLENFISNHLMNDLHGICVDESHIITVLTGKDTIVFSDHDGNIVEHFTIGSDLSVYMDTQLEETDWRFLSKQFRGATGRWHFNYVQKFDEELWLTSRNISGFVVVDLRTRSAHLRTMNHMTPVLLHDGVFHDGQFLFTSVDGKILIAEPADTAKFSSREGGENVEKFTRDLMVELIRIEETEFRREPNWCRGIERVGDVIYVTVDGRYDTDLSFGLLGLKRSGEKVMESRLRWQDIGSENDLRYVTGFDILAL